MPFPSDSRVDVEQVSDKNWKLLLEIRYEGKTQSFNAPVSMLTDFASVPRVFVWLLPRYGHYTMAAIIHDHLWRQVVPSGSLSLRDADGVFRRAMRELGVPFLQRWVMWAAVRWGAVMKGGLRQGGWWIELPRVLLITFLVLPIVLPPAVLVGVGLVLFLLLEVVVWVLLWIGRAVRHLFQVPSKAVNAPSLSWKL